jgi:hypothetical protein
MAGLSVAQCAALAQIIENVPDRTLRQLALAVGTMAGERARTFETMLEEASVDRARRERGMVALAPMFAPRPDGVATTWFPPRVLPRLWKIVCVGQADVMTYLDVRDVYEDDTARISTVCARLWTAAAAAVRDQPEVVWPVSLGEPTGMGREAGLQALAQMCDLGGLAHRALPSLKAWISRPDADQIAELRLLLRDAGTISDQGARQLLEILFAHMTHAPRLLRMVANSSQSAAHDGFLSASELAVFVDRLLDGAEVRVRRIGAYAAGDPVEPLRADLEWTASLLIETDTTVSIQTRSAWGKRIIKVRSGVSGSLGSLLGRVSKAVDLSLPMVKVQTVGRMKRELPQLDVAIDPEARARAEAALDLVRIARGPAAAFGCDAQRLALVADLMDRLVAYADLGIEEINAGVVVDEGLAIQRMTMAADFMERIEAETDARAVRRRVAVAGVSMQGVSPNAA